MISHKHKFIYARVAKTGSSTITDYLCENVGDVTKIEGWTENKHHIPLWYYKENISIKKFESYYKFTFVRNPWDRLVSAHEYDKQFGNQLIFKEWIKLSPVSYNTISEHKYGIQYDFVNGCDFIGKFENLQEDFNTVCDKIGIPQQQLPHKNKTKHKHYTEYYDDETREIVAEKYAKDIEYFGYKFGE
tara:strand:- start:714 stop:1277 length:564 start_codon:yes stop_codon:yes gene_type:complete